MDITSNDVSILQNAIEANNTEVLNLSIGKCIITEYPKHCGNCILNRVYINDNTYCFDLCKDKHFKKII